MRKTTLIGLALGAVVAVGCGAGGTDAVYRARTVRTRCELAFCDCRAGSVAWLFGCCT
jgi:hypothetical protein